MASLPGDGLVEAALHFDIDLLSITDSGDAWRDTDIAVLAMADYSDIGSLCGTVSWQAHIPAEPMQTSAEAVDNLEVDSIGESIITTEKDTSDSDSIASADTEDDRG